MLFKVVVSAVGDIVPLLSQFPSLHHCVLTVGHHPLHVGVDHLIASCGDLRYLKYYNKLVKLPRSLSSIFLNQNLQ